MRFGIMSMQIDAIVPDASEDVSSEAIAAHIAHFNLTKLVRSLASQGFNSIELSGDLSLFLPHTFAPNSIRESDQAQSRTGAGI